MFDSSRPTMAAELLDSEQRFRGTFEQAAVGMAHVGLDGRWLLVNQKLCDIVGYSREELLDRTFQDITHPDDLSTDLSFVNQLLASEIDTYTLEKRYIHKNGTMVWINLTVSLVRNANGTPKYFISVIENIDLRKQVEAALQRSEQLYRTLVNAVPQLMWLTRPDGTLEFLNQHWYSYAGVAKDASLGQDWLELIHPDDREQTIRSGTIALGHGKEYQVEARFRQHDGSYCWHVAHVVPLRDNDANIIAWLGTATEIDKRKRAEEALGFLAEASAALSASFDYKEALQIVARLAIPRIADYCVVDVIGDNGQIERVAAEHHDPSKQHLVQQLRQYAPRQDSSSPLLNVLRTGVAEFFPRITEDLRRSMAQDEQHFEMLRLLSLNSVIMAPIVVRGQPLGVLSLAAVGPQRQYDQTDFTLALDLARRAAQAIDNARLYQVAQTAIRERDALVGIASHELKNALAALSGQAHILQRRSKREGTLTERNERSLNIIVEQSERLNSMLDALLDVSRIGSNQFSIERKPVDLVHLTDQIVGEAHAAVAEQGRHTINFHNPEQSLFVDGDALRLGQVLRNVIGNAIKYSQPGGAVDISIEQQGNQVCVIVRDQGVGIPAEALPFLFERFYRANTSTTMKGLGVGLYVVQEIVAQHGGTVAVQSTQGSGSTFTICLPPAVGTTTEAV